MALPRPETLPSLRKDKDGSIAFCYTDTMNARDVVLQFIELINQHDIRGLVALMTEDHRFIDSEGNIVQGLQRMKAAWKSYFRLFPDYRIQAHHVFAEHAMVVVTGEASGTYSCHGNLMEENSWSVPAAWMARVEDGKIQLWQVFADNEPVRRTIKETGLG